MVRHGADVVGERGRVVAVHLTATRGESATALLDARMATHAGQLRALERVDDSDELGEQQTLPLRLVLLLHLGLERGDLTLQSFDESIVGHGVLPPEMGHGFTSRNLTAR